ncbi:MAG: type I restriction endonuclease [Candidatus Kapabacteria bacterium]|nr:type I restriction endonuclease [Candidatus Kapabacteria bacterium]
MILNSDVSEKRLESIIEKSLIEESGYVKGLNQNYNREFCLDTKLLFEFLENSQPKEIAKLKTNHDDKYQEKFCSRLSGKIKKDGVINVLRNGVDDNNAKFELLYKLPSSDLNQTLISNYSKNIFSVSRQLKYSLSNSNSLDMVVFINGIPISTFELKNELTNQNIKDAIRQYQNDRDPKEPLFQFKRCIVHFAVDTDLVYMTTKLQGENSIFLPFNKGYNNGAGNPLNPNGLKTDYLWKKILKKENLSNIVEKYAQVFQEIDDDGNKKEKQIFPRFHQYDLVTKLLADVKLNGAGKRYLIEHSAGSGKSNSISWLAHQLVGLFDMTNSTPVFDSIIVVTDRKVLDKQIRDNIKQFAQVKGVVVPITGGSSKLKDALEEGKQIIITTIQKFPHIVKQISELSSSKFAIIIDEAHSSQSGSSASKMSIALSKKDLKNELKAVEENETYEDMINRIVEKSIKSKKMLKNASYFAFTATPKNKTLETFGIKRDDGKFESFHLYSMKQAIDEEFILDVLKNYTTFNSFYRIKKATEANEDKQIFDKNRAQKKIRFFVESHPDSIEKKTKIMINHFLNDVIRKKKIKGLAKAMLVTSSIQQAVRFKIAFDSYLSEIKSPFKAIVAFSGTKKDEGKEYTEESMNGFPSIDIPIEFKKNEYRFLIVANKFQTGFDQPLLHTMYVHKKLEGVQAVQTLSRINRAYKPYKTDTFILDFDNTHDDIKEAFKPYYETTILSKETDPNKLNDLKDDLSKFQIYNNEQVTNFTFQYLKGIDRQKLDPILDISVENFKNDLDSDQQAKFKIQAKSFTRVYNFLVQILVYPNVEWEKLYWFLKFLLNKLPSDFEDLAKGITDRIDLDSYKTSEPSMLNISIEENRELNPIPSQTGAGGYQPELDELEAIIKEFNERFGTEWTDDDKIRRFLFEDIPNEMAKDLDFIKATMSSDKQNTKITFDQKLDDKFQDLIHSHTKLYKRYSDDDAFKDYVCSMLFDIVYNRSSFLTK